MNAISGSDSTKVIRLQSLIHNQVALQLMDSGSSHTFLSEHMTSRVPCVLLDIPPIEVKVANGQVIHCNKLAKNVTWLIQGQTFYTDALVLPFSAYDMVLGMDWLEKFSPMNCEWSAKWIEFQYNHKLVRLQGVVNTTAPVPQEISVEQMEKLHKTNEIWAVAVVYHIETAIEDHKTAVLSVIQDLLHQYSDVFQTPSELPPLRDYDHTISLLPGTAPVNSRPYRYPPHQKDETERQMSEMLASGIIEKSVSPFASPVLLVKKKDGS